MIERTCWKEIIAVLIVSISICGCATTRQKPSSAPIPAQTELRNRIIHTALSLKGKPYKSDAKGPDSFDCSGFIYYVFKKSQIILPPSTNELNRVGKKISLKNVQPADLVFFKTKKNFHVGIMLNGKEFIHSSTQKGIAIDSLDSLYWKGKSPHFRTIL